MSEENKEKKTSFPKKGWKKPEEQLEPDFEETIINFMSANLTLLERVVELLASINDSNKGYSPPPERKSTTSAPPKEQKVYSGSNKFNAIANALPEKAQDLINLESKDGTIFVRPKQYLGSELFAKVSSIIREQFGGEYVSEGKNSHFRVSA